MSDHPQFVALSAVEAEALFKLASALDGFISEDHPVYTAGTKLDEQMAAQMRDPYAEVADELRDALADYAPDWVFHMIDFEAIAKRVMDRAWGVYENG